MVIKINYCAREIVFLGPVFFYPFALSFQTQNIIGIIDYSFFAVKYLIYFEYEILKLAPY